MKYVRFSCRQIALYLITLCISSSLIACGSTPPPKVDKDGLRDRADQEHSQL